MTDHENELDRLRKENDLLRGLMPALGAPCAYCGEKDISKCARGFPGCPQADDLMIGQDETEKRLITEVDQLRRQHVGFRNAVLTAKRALSDAIVFQNDQFAIAQRECAYALSDTAGADYISKESVKPLVEALRGAEVLIRCLAERNGASLENRDNWCRLKDALSHAKSLGLPTEKEEKPQ